MAVDVLFVCLGNICRSPTAHGIFQQKVLALQPAVASQITVDSAGTGDWHIGSHPDRRAQAAARQRGYDLSGLRARQVSREDFRRFDYILAMDRQNHASLARLAPPDFSGVLGMFLHYLPDGGQSKLEVPDPYFGGDAGFDQVLDLVEAAADGLLSHIMRQHFPDSDTL